MLTRTRGARWTRARAWTSGGAALALTLGGLSFADGTAHAGVGQCDNGYVCVIAGSGGTLPVGSPGGGGSSGGGNNVCQFQGQAMACYVPGVGWLSASDGCYYMPMQPQPPAGDPLWQGHQPGDGDVYVRTCTLNGGAGAVSVWMQALPPAPAQMTPAELALRMVKVIPVGNARIASAPGAGPRRHGLVHLPVMHWLVGVGKNYATTGDYGDTYIPKNKAVWRTASVPQYSVTAWLWSSKVIWDAGDGKPDDCNGPGKPFQGVLVAGCDHIYDTANSAYYVTAVVRWHVHWRASDGTEGDFDLGDYQAGNQLVLSINELQVLN